MFKCKRCGSTNSSHIITTDHQVIFDCADCEYVTTFDHEEIRDIEECPECGYEGVHTEGVEEDMYIKICPACKNTFAVEINRD